MAWVYLIIAGLLETGWAIGLKYTEGFTKPVPSILTAAAIAAGSSLRGLSLVTTARSAEEIAAPIAGRLARSRSPPAPINAMTRPPVRRRPRFLAMPSSAASMKHASG